MPDARIAPEGTWRAGVSILQPYRAIWSGVAVMPWLEGSFRYTQIHGVPGFPDAARRETFGDFKDKSFDVKVLVLPERGLRPALAVGAQDVAGGTGVFRAPYVAASKQLGAFDLTLGYGAQRIDGPFGGVRWSPGLVDGLSFVAEYDAYDYRRDRGATPYDKAVAAGIEYRNGPLGVKAFSAHGRPALNVYVSIPLEQERFVPRAEEPPPYARVNPRPSEAQWDADPEHERRLARALVAQDFREVSLHYANGRLEAALTNNRISSMPRAVGRAARTLLSFAPLETRELRITYLQGSLPFATYTFVNVPLLQRYFNGMATRQQVAGFVSVEYARPEHAAIEDGGEALRAFAEPLPESIVVGRHGADLVTMRGENVAGGVFSVRPALSTYLNDPSGAFKYDLSAVAGWHRPLGSRTFLQVEGSASLAETVSEVTQPSNSTLPHVRSDIAEYRRGGRVKLQRLLVNRFYQPSERLYGRASAGIYEEMFSGAGGQLLYLPKAGAWAFDVSADWVRQRDFDGGLGHRDYDTVTAIASLNYRMARGMTATVRAGRFLAQDEGARVELKRRFASGVEVGAWYTVTNGHDTTSPGSPSSPYRDKGLFMSIPLETMLARDTQATASFAISPWTRDVGQMVASPGDLYAILERPLRQMHSHDGLSGLGDRDDDYDLPRLGVPAGREWPGAVLGDLFSAGEEARRVDWLETALVGGGLIVASKGFDSRAEKFARRNRMEAVRKAGNAVPLLAIGASALFALDDSRPRLADAGLAALEAGGLAFLAAEGLERLGGGRFPSGHAAVAWAAITPYAQEFGMPWLYGVALLTNASRILGRDHDLSDSVGGAVIGHALGSLAWRARKRTSSEARLVASPSFVGLEWDLR